MEDSPKVKIVQYENILGKKHQVTRFVWRLVWISCVSWLPRSTGRRWKNILLNIFGAKIHKTANIYSSAKVYYPAYLEMAEYSCLADDVECYNVAPVKIGAHSTVSQGAYLCTASHDISDPKHSLITKPIVIEDQAWVGAKAYIGMGVMVGQGAVVGATASVYKDVEPWTVVGGNPAKFIKKRELKEKQ